MDETCGTCRFFGDFGGQYGDGLCRRHSPVAALGLEDDRATAVWPRVTTSKWCGDWEGQTKAAGA